MIDKVSALAEIDGLVVNKKRKDLDLLSELQLWRMKRMNGILKKDVWIAWNEETDLINKLRQKAGE